MRLLLFSDLHCNADAARRLVEMSRDVDVVVGAGDFANVRRGLRVSLDILRDISQPAILVAGNNETTDELRAACSGWPSAHVLHGTSVSVQGVIFYGIGGGIPVTPFGDWSYDFDEIAAARLLKSCPKGCVLVTHSPPKGWVDISSQGKSLGSTAIRDVVLQRAPKLLVCGHIHGSAGMRDRHGATDLINAGPQGMIWELDRADIQPN